MVLFIYRQQCKICFVWFLLQFFVCCTFHFLFVTLFVLLCRRNFFWRLILDFLLCGKNKAHFELYLAFFSIFLTCGCPEGRLFGEFFLDCEIVMICVWRFVYAVLNFIDVFQCKGKFGICIFTYGRFCFFIERIFVTKRLTFKFVCFFCKK